MNDHSTAPPTTRVERTLPPDNGEQGFADLPTTRATPAPQDQGSRRIGAGSAMPTGFLRPEMLQRERPFVEFTLAAKLMGLEWGGSGYSEKHLRFAMIELTPEEEERAVGLAGSGVKLQKSFNEMVTASIYLVGGERVNYEAKGKWLSAIGPRARKAVDRCFNEMNGIEESAGESILATATHGRG